MAARYTEQGESKVREKCVLKGAEIRLSGSPSARGRGRMRARSRVTNFPRNSHSSNSQLPSKIVGTQSRPTQSS